MSIITTSEFKLYRQISGTDSARDARIQVLIDGVVSGAERYLQRTFASGTISAETHDYNGDGVYWLRATPITSLTSVSLVDVNNNVTPLSSGNYKYDAETGEIHVYVDAPAASSLWQLGIDDIAGVHESFRAVKFAYVGGYAAIPADLKLVLLQMVDDLYTSNAFGNGVNEKLAGYNLGEMSFTFKDGAELQELMRSRLLPFKQGGVL